MCRRLIFAPLLFTAYGLSLAQAPLITDLQSRKTISLNGKWQYIMDPYETGFYNYRFHERNENDREAYWNSDIPVNKTDRKEHGYIEKYSLSVPGDWNHQEQKFLYYEGTVWYKKSFDYKKLPGRRVFLYFGAVNYRADVYLNGKKLGMHKGGFTPFNFEVPDSMLKEKGNFLVVRADNKRLSDEVPAMNTDWWNFGGITREVKLVELPLHFIQDYFIQLKKPAGEAPSSKDANVEGWIKLSGFEDRQKVEVSIPELKFTRSFEGNSNDIPVNFKLPQVQLWSPGNPKLYTLIIKTDKDRIEDKIGFRTIETYGKELRLNGKAVFLRGISIHEEIPGQVRRAWSREDALQLLGWAKELGCNMVRLAHYPHDETMTRAADSLGILIWSEIPVYWTIDFSNPEVFEKSKTQLTEMITRDRNRSAIIIWSVGNETPVNAVRTDFMHRLISTARELDPSRLVSAALEVNYNSGKNLNIVDDPLGEFTDLVAFNEYLGWYGGLPSDCRLVNWGVRYNKPLFISETGAEALGGFHGDSLTRWSEEYQEWYFREQINMLKRMPDNFVGICPWLLVDYRSPRRNNPVYQEGWNNKGLIDRNGRKKKAFEVLKEYYADIRKKVP